MGSMETSTTTSSSLHPSKNTSLSINKSSKISKSVKKPNSSSSSATRPIAKIYNADPSEFRRVVQELTGTKAAPPVLAAPQAHPAPKTTTTTTRLQRIAPPPLRPSFPVPRVSSTFPPSHFSPLQPLPSPHQPINSQTMPHLPMLSPHLFAPLPALTPGDNTWANPFEFSANLFTQQNRAIDAIPPGRAVDTAFVPQSSAVGPGASATLAPAAPRLPWNSPVIWSPRFLPSPLPLSPNFLPPLSPSLFSPGCFPPLSGFPSPRSPGFAFTNYHNPFPVNGPASSLGSSQDFTFQGPGGLGGNRFSGVERKNTG